MPEDRLSKYTFMKVCDLDTIKIEAGIRHNDDDYLGVDIDVFPIDFMPRDFDLYQRKVNRVKLLRKWYALVNTKLFLADLKPSFVGVLKLIKRICIAIVGHVLSFLPRYD